MSSDFLECDFDLPRLTNQARIGVCVEIGFARHCLLMVRRWLISDLRSRLIETLLD